MPTAEIRAALSKATSEDQLLNEATKLMDLTVGADSADLLLVGPSGSLVLRASTTMSDLIHRVRIGRGVGLVGQVIKSGGPVVVADKLQEDKHYRPMPGTRDEEFQSALGVLVGCPEDPVGVALWRRLEPWKPSKAEIAAAESIGRDLALAIGVFRTAYEAGSQSNRMSALTEVTRSLSDSPYLEEILQLLVNVVARRFNYRVVTVRLLDEKRGELILRATQATNKAYQRKRAIRLGESIAGRVIKTAQTMIVEDVQTDPDYIGHDLAEEQGLRSMICVPLTIQGRAVGVLTSYTGEVREFAEDEVEMLETLAKQAAVSIEHAKLQVRNTLMQEMHHRVKNNLQQVASLLRLQIRQSHYKSLEEALGDSLSRILAIAAVHELLSRDDLDHVSIKSIASSLGQHMQQSFMLPGKTIAFSVRGDDVYLNTTQATQIALILNEMIANAVEHGFAVTDKGEVHINIEERNGKIGVWVSNDGDPLPPDFDPMGGQLGLQIIRSLVGALGGQYALEDRLGWTVCQVTFERQAAE
ncbi:MAG: GAF domain-containing protein [Armatimonadetes bacterium]|nr:GAF domain-containing protein [Armatimonadota bacterium]